MALLSVRGLEKRYEGFKLDNISFELEEGYIMGFVGRNGAGKTTTLKSMLGLVHPDSGEVVIDSLSIASDELACKQRIGVVFGEFDYYKKKTIKTITSVFKRFYDNWSDETYRSLLARFELDESKRIEQLSSGMRVKYAIALALSHDARLIILDEPTSGLDPVSRDDLLELFQSLIEDGTRSILFSTHIISDLEKCADYVTYIKDGRLLVSSELAEFLDSYRLVKGTNEQLTDEVRRKLIGVRRNKFGFDALIPRDRIEDAAGLDIQNADLESIMLHIEKE